MVCITVSVTSDHISDIFLRSLFSMLWNMNHDDVFDAAAAVLVLFSYWTCYGRRHQ